MNKYLGNDNSSYRTAIENINVNIILNIIKGFAFNVTLNRANPVALFESHKGAIGDRKESVNIRFVFGLRTIVKTLCDELATGTVGYADTEILGHVVVDISFYSSKVSSGGTPIPV